MSEDRRLSEQWNDLQERGQVPDRGEGRTAEQVERDKGRRRRRMPSEDRRQGRKVSPTLSDALIGRLRAICKAEGYTGRDGDGELVSSVVEDLLWVGVQAYEEGELVSEEVVTVIERRLRRKSAE